MEVSYNTIDKRGRKSLLPTCTLQKVTEHIQYQHTDVNISACSRWKSNWRSVFHLHIWILHCSKGVVLRESFNTFGNTENFLFFFNHIDGASKENKPLLWVFVVNYFGQTAEFFPTLWHETFP